MKKFEVFRGMHVVVTVSHISYVLNDGRLLKYRAKVTIIESGVGSSRVDVRNFSNSDPQNVINGIEDAIELAKIIDGAIVDAHADGKLGVRKIECFAEGLA